MKNCFRLLFFICCAALLFSSCQKEYSNETGAAQISAGTLKDSTGNCLPDSVVGTFYDGITPRGDTAYVEIQVDVTQTGSYNISSDFQNGFEFADSGFFTSTGINVIRLKPIGTPILPNTTIFSLSFDSSICSFSVNVQDSTGTGIHSGGDTVGSGDPDAGSGSWQFATDSGGFYTGTFSAVIFQKDTTLGGTDLELGGYTKNNDTVFNLAVHFEGSTITPGTYYTQITGSDTHANAVFALGLVSTGDAIYEAEDNPGDGTNIGVTITSYNSSTKVVSGTFTGKALDDKYDPATIGIVNGTFTATVP